MQAPAPVPEEAKVSQVSKAPEPMAQPPVTRQSKPDEFESLKGSVVSNKPAPTQKAAPPRASGMKSPTAL